MATFKEKAQLFVTGLLVGLIIAGSFFIFKLDDYFEKLKPKNITKTFYLYKEKKDEEKDKILQNKKNEEIKKTYNSGNKRIIAGKQTLNEERVKTIKPFKKDSAYVTETIDSASIEGGVYGKNPEEIIVEKDELMASSILPIINLNVLSKAEQTADSLLQKVSGIRDDKNSVKKEFVVELWKSPLHYKGYKMSKNKLLLYGFPTVENLKIYRLDENTYLKTQTLVYELKQSYEFISFKPITNQEIIKKLK